MATLSEKGLIEILKRISHSTIASLAFFLFLVVFLFVQIGKDEWLDKLFYALEIKFWCYIFIVVFGGIVLYKIVGAFRAEGLEIEMSTSSSIKVSGLVEIRTGVSNEELKAFLAQAEHRIRIIVPWFVDPLTIKDVLRPKLQISKFSIQVFLLHPSSVHLKKRGEVIAPNQPDYGPSENRRTLLALAEAFAGYHDRINIYLCDSLPSVFITQVDEQVLIGFHLNAGIALKYPHLECEINRDGIDTPIGRMVNDEFAILTEMSHEVELASVKLNNDNELEFEYKQT